MIEMNTTSRNSSVSSEDAGKAFPIPVMSLYISNTITNVALNSLVLVVIHRQRELQDVMRIMYQILTILNIFLGICWSIYSSNWFFFNNPHTCAIIKVIFPFPFHVTVTLAVAGLCGIHFVLYIIISKPLHHHLIVTKTRIKFGFVSLLIVALLVHSVYLPIGKWSLVDIVMKLCLDQEIENVWFLVFMVFNITPPALALVFILVIQILIVRIVRKQTRAVTDMDMIHIAHHRSHENLDVEQPARNCCHGILTKQIGQYYKQNKGLFTALLYTCSFAIIWIPILIYYNSSNVSPIVIVCDLIACSGTWIPAIVYIITNKEARSVCHNFFR